MNLPAFDFVYTPQITFIFGVLLVFGTFLVYKLFERMKLKIDEKFLYSVLPWILLIAIVRVMVDAKTYPNIFLLTTPGIIFSFLAVMLPSFYLGNLIEKKHGFKYWKTVALIGSALIILHIPFLKIVNMPGLVFVLIVWLMSLIVLRFSDKLLKIPSLAFWAISTHLLDASATSVSIKFFGYVEKHFLPNHLIQTTTPWIMFPLKLLFIVPAVWVVWKYSEEKKLRNFLTIVILVLGLAPGLRDLIRLALGV